MFLVKFDGIDLLVEDLETVDLVKSNADEIINLRDLANEAMVNFSDKSYESKLKKNSEKLKSKFTSKFVFGYPFDARSGELYALDKKMIYSEVLI